MNVVRDMDVKRGLRWHAQAWVRHPEIPGLVIGEGKHRNRRTAMDNAHANAKALAGAELTKIRRKRRGA